MAAIAAGVLAALVAARGTPPRRGMNTLLCVFGAMGLAAVLLVGSILWPVLRDGYLLLLTFSVACLLIGLQWAETQGWGRPLPGFGWLRACGRLSYEIYLTHMFVVFAAVCI